ncbi:MAG: hypothetical protein ACRD1S_17360 [Vicinamibacterales bacterium]
MRLLAGLVCLVFTLPLPSPRTVSAQHLNIGSDGRDVTSCSDLTVTSDEEVARANESLTAPAGSPVKLTASRNGGVWIVGSHATQVEIEACKIAVASSIDRAQELLAGIRVQQQAGGVAAAGPAGSRWHVYFIVRAPRGSNVGAETSNGPLSLRDADGTFSMQATNGPIAISNSRGTIDARTQNGPISLKGGAGGLNLRVQNGPLSIKLDGAEWEGSGLTGETRNGPLSLTVPGGYRSGVLIEADGHSPMRCSRCADARRTWDDDKRRIEFGGGPPIIKLTTSNGPVSVEQR